jgi:exopolyphosphatase / guanosine-5'-triphosphate,3'-diphosphate pyrophosphatase
LIIQLLFWIFVYYKQSGAFLFRFEWQFEQFAPFYIFIKFKIRKKIELTLIQDLKFMPYRAAIIDLGTNTFHILILEWEGQRYQILDKLQVPVKLGKGAFSDHTIREDAFSRGIATMIEFKSLLDRYQISKVEMYGTSVLRNAQNAADFAKEAEIIIGHPINVISGLEEAELIYTGVKSAVPLGGEPHLIMDIGGGSVEFIIADDSKIFWRKSYEIGAARLVEKFSKTDPMDEESIHQLESFLEAELSMVWVKAAKYQVKTLVGASGSFESVSGMEMEIYHSNRQADHFVHHIIDLHHFEELYHKIISSTIEELSFMPGLPAFRVEMITVGIVMIHYLMHRLSLKKMIASDYALKEGVMVRLMNNPLIQNSDAMVKK